MKFLNRSIVYKLTLALSFAAVLFGAASNCYGGYTITITEVSPTTLTVSDNDPNGSWTTNITASVNPATGVARDYWTSLGLPITDGVVLPIGISYTAEPGEANFVNEVRFGAASPNTFGVISDETLSDAGDPDTIFKNNTSVSIGQDSKGNQVFLLFNDLPAHNAQGQDAPDAGSTALLLALSLLLISLGAKPNRHLLKSAMLMFFSKRC